MDRRGIATGLAIGVFWGVLLPLGQFFFAAATALLVRVNLPVALLGTFVSNPFTIAPTYVAAYFVGSVLLGIPVDAELMAGPGTDASAAAWLSHLGHAAVPLVVGLASLACASAALVYVSVRVVWRYAVWRARARVRSTRASRP